MDDLKYVGFVGGILVAAGLILSLFGYSVSGIVFLVSGLSMLIFLLVIVAWKDYEPTEPWLNEIPS